MAAFQAQRTMADPGVSNSDEISTGQVLTLVGAIVGLVLTLVFLRLACNVMIDVCIVCDMGSARRQIHDYWISRILRRMVGGRLDEDSSTTQLELVDVPAFLSRMSPEERTAVFNSVLPSKTVTGDDLIAWRGKHSDTHCDKSIIDCEKHANHDAQSVCSDAILCSICIHDLAIGDEAVTTQSCQHVFHRHCILQWLDSMNNACPYCRAVVITAADVKDALQRQSVP